MAISADKLTGILGQLQQPGKLSPTDLVNTLEELLKLLQELPPGPRPLNPLKKAGAWKDKPLRTDTPDVPIYVKVSAEHPCKLDFENVPPAVLAHLKVEPDGFANSKITIGLLADQTS